MRDSVWNRKWDQLMARLHKNTADSVAQLIYARERDLWARLWPSYVAIQRAHALMLAEQRLIPAAVASRADRYLRHLEATGPSGLSPGPAVDLYFAFEQALVAAVGEEAGSLHLGRSRNDLNATAGRMLAREEILAVVGATLELGDAILLRAADHLDTVFPGMTHRQAAQPVTVGFWLLAVASALERDLGRYTDAYARTNKSPLGAAAFSGTGIHIDRSRTAQLLGFDGIIDNALDAVASRDVLVEFASAMTMQMILVGRVAADLIFWNSSVVGFIEVADEYAGVSSIMPQKKNPLALEHCRAWGGLVAGDLMALLAVARATYVEHCRDWAEMLAPILRSSAFTAGAVTLLREVVQTLRFNEGRMRAAAAEGFATATDVADWLAAEQGWSFRTAHSVVAEAVASSLNQRPPGELTVERLNEASMMVTGARIALDRATLADLLDPTTSLRRRSSAGGASPEILRQQLRARQARTESVRRWLDRQRRRLSAARAELDLAATRQYNTHV